MSGISYRWFLKHLAERWQLTDAQYRYLAGLGEEAIPALQQIDTTLNQLFANSPFLADLWMTSPNKAFDNETPIALIMRRGMTGLREVVHFLCLKD